MTGNEKQYPISLRILRQRLNQISHMARIRHIGSKKTAWKKETLFATHVEAKKSLWDLDKLTGDLCTPKL